MKSLRVVLLVGNVVLERMAVEAVVVLVVVEGHLLWKRWDCCPL